MESRSRQRTPNGARQEVAQARQRARGAKRAQAIVVATSMAATLLGWVSFAHTDVQAPTTAQSEAPAIVASVQQTATPTPPAIATTTTSQPPATADWAWLSRAA